MAELLVDQLRTMARLYGDEVAFHDLDGGRTLTFAEWNARSNQLARGLIADGIAKGDRVAIDLPSSEILWWIVAYAAIHKAGGVAVPVNTRLTSRELVTILGHAEVAAVITCHALLTGQSLHEVWPQVPSIRWIASVDQAAFDMRPIEMEMADDAEDVQVALDEGDLADIMYTSGTTGLPKGVAVRHRNVALLPNGEVPWSGTYWLQGSPPFTFAGISFIYNPMKLGMGCRFQSTFNATTWIDYVEQHRPTATFVVPAMAQLLINEPRWPTADLSSLTLVSCGSAPLPPETLVHLCERFPTAVVTNGYGMTEAGPAYLSLIHI